MPGLDRLIAVCRKNSLPLRLSPPLAPAPPRGELILGEPLDPQLVDLYQRLGAAQFGPLTLHGPGTDREGLLPRNEWLRTYPTPHFHSSLVFGWETGFAYYHGTVPKLADSQGLQPVIFMDDHETKYAVPVASSVDRFFELYAHFLERVTAPPEAIHHVTFPWSMAPWIALDEPLMQQALAGHFDFLANGERDALEWLDKLRAEAPT